MPHYRPTELYFDVACLVVWDFFLSLIREHDHNFSWEREQTFYEPVDARSGAVESETNYLFLYAVPF